MIQLLFTDGHLLAVNKPGAMPVLPDKTKDISLIDRLREQLPGDGDLELPHRLDRPVSGVLLVARSRATLAALSASFASRSIRKTYWAIVHGTPPEEGSWEHRLVHDRHQHRARIVERPEVEPCRTAFRRLSVGHRYSLVELQPHAGFFHQLRAQCGAAGHPIKGDVKYGARRGEPDHTIALHARSLDLIHPITHVHLVIEAPAPGSRLWDALVTAGVR